MFKSSDTVELSLDITDAEKKTANELVGLLKLLMDKLLKFNNYLNILYNPFKEYQTVSQESAYKYRASLWRFTEEVEKLYFGEKESKESKESNQPKDWPIKKIAFVAAAKLKEFSTDTHIAKLLESFSDDATDVEDNVTSLIAIIRNYESSTFRNNVVSSMENVKKEISELKKIIEDRIIDHVNTNILAKNWIEDSSQELNIPVQEREPYVVRLYKEREQRRQQKG